MAPDREYDRRIIITQLDDLSQQNHEQLQATVGE